MSEALQGGDTKERKRPPRMCPESGVSFFGDKSANAALPFDIITDVKRPWIALWVFSPARRGRPLSDLAGRHLTAEDYFSSAQARRRLVRPRRL